MAESDDLTDSSKLIATFEIDDHHFGFPTRRVLEIVRLGEFTPVHNSPDFILGIVNLRGRIVTVMDLGKKLDLDGLPPSRDSQIFVVDWRQEAIGFLVDHVGGILQLEEAEIRPVPQNIQPVQAKVLEGFLSSGGILFGLLKVDALLEEPAGRVPAQQL